MIKALRGIAVLGLTVAALSFGPVAAQAQFHTVELTPTIGYLFGGKFSTSTARYEIPSALSYGAQLSFKVRSGGWVDLTYIRQDSEVRETQFGSGTTEKLFDLGSNYIFVGGRQEAPQAGPAIPFFNFSLGTTNLSPKNQGGQGTTYNSIWKFAFMAGVGVKVPLGSKVMFNTQLRTMATTLWGGGGVWCGFGGCSVGISSGNAFWQGEVLAGLTIPLGG